MSQFGHLSHTPLPTCISHSHLSQTLPYVYTHHPTLIYIPQRRLFNPQLSSSFIFPSLSPAFHFRFFWTIYGRFFATITISHSYISSTIGFTSPHTTDYPILYPYPYCPLPPIFAFFGLFMDTFCYYHLSPSLFIF